MKKLYSILMIVLPIFVGSASILEIVSYLSDNGTTMNPVICVCLAAAGMGTGIYNIIKLIDKQ